MGLDLVDIGVNLTHDSFDADRDTVIERARNAGVTRMIVTGTSVPSSERAIRLCQEHPGFLRSTAGIHPHHATDYDDTRREALRKMTSHDCVVAIGECGLDFFRDFSPRDAQREAFTGQLDLAAECQLPVFLHQRDAHGEFLSVLETYRDRLIGGVAHCFTGGKEQLEAYLELGLYIGVTGWVCDERRGEALRAALPYIPAERLLLETDAPYLLPRDLEPRPRNRRNEPGYLPHVLRRVSEIMELDPEAVAEATTRNARKLFGLPELSP